MIRTKALLGDMSFHERGACKDVINDTLFHPDRDETKAGTWKRAVNQYCAECPVRAECQRFGIANRYSGIWGGVLYNSLGKVVPAYLKWAGERKTRTAALAAYRKKHPTKVA